MATTGVFTPERIDHEQTTEQFWAIVEAMQTELQTAVGLVDAAVAGMTRFDSTAPEVVPPAKPVEQFEKSPTPASPIPTSENATVEMLKNKIDELHQKYDQPPTLTI